MPALGEMAPDFSTRDSDGHEFRLSSHRGQQKVVLYFFPACFTPGCDREAGKFRDEFPQFTGRSTQVVGVSNDDAETAKRFREHFHLPFPVLPDPEGKIITLYGVGKPGGHARRVTFLVGLEGRIEEVVDARDPEAHVTQTLQRSRSP